MSVLETYGGHYFDFLAPDAGQVFIEDVAHALANTCRFGGHTKRFYSVAEHAALVAHYVNAPVALAALHHDTHETYLGDIPTPLKLDLGGKYRRLVRLADAAVCQRFGIEWTDMHSEEVKEADQLALRLEARELKVSRGVGEHWGHDRPPRHRIPWRLGLMPLEAKRLFLHMHRCYGGQL